MATVNLTATYPPAPRVRRLAEYWWDGETEPWYGDVGAIRREGYIYAYGHAIGSQHVYLARVAWQEAEIISCYEYWNGESWQAERLYNVSEKEGIFWAINQGQVIYSNYYDCYMFVYCGSCLALYARCMTMLELIPRSDIWMNSKILAQTAHRPEGPWSDPITLFQATPITEGSAVYAAVPHPYYDPSGKSLVVTFTNHPNTIQAIKIVSDVLWCWLADSLTMQQTFV